MYISTKKTTTTKPQKHTNELKKTKLEKYLNLNNKNNFKDEEGNYIENRFGYLKEAINANIRRMNLDIDDLLEKINTKIAKQEDLTKNKYVKVSTKDGNLFIGKITYDKNEKIKLDTQLGEIIINKNDIKKITTK